MALYPPDDPFLINTTIPLVVILLGVSGFIGANIAHYLAEQRMRTKRSQVSSSQSSQSSQSSDTSLNHLWLWGIGGFVLSVVLGIGLLLLLFPGDPFLATRAVPLVVRWYGVFIVGGAMTAASVAAYRSKQRAISPDHAWNQLMVGLILGIIGARLYYVVFEWQRFGGEIWNIINITTGGLAIHGAIGGALVAVVWYTRRHVLSLWQWLDIYVPGFLLAQAIGRWGNFFNQEAYGAPTTWGVGVAIEPLFRLPPFNDMLHYPPETLFHATFLYESVWNVVGVLLLLWLDSRFGTHNPTRTRWLRHGDLFFLYCIYYSAGRFWIEGLRTDSLYMGTLRTAQIASLLLVSVGTIALVINHVRQVR